MPHPRRSHPLGLAQRALVIVAFTASSCSSGEPLPPDAESSLDSSREAVLGAPVWSVTGPTLHDYSFRPTLTVLPSGKVLLTGTTSNEIYDPATNTWAPAAPLLLSASGGSLAVLLQNDKVLVPLKPNSQIYNPLIDTWSLAAPPPLSAGSPYDSAVLLPNGDVLLNSQRYHPATDTWAFTSPPPFTLEGPALLLPSGKVLFTKGPYTYDPTIGGAVGAGAVYDPATDSWAQIAPRPPLAAPSWLSLQPYMAPYDTFYATLLLNGQVLVNGMTKTYPPPGPPFPPPVGSPFLGWQIYDPIADTWSLGHDLSAVLNGQAEALLKSGEVLLAAGQPLFPNFDTTEVYDPITRAINVTTPPNCPGLILDGPGIARLPAGRVLLVCASTGQQGAALYDRTLGVSCNAAADCDSGFCVDGVCCSTACDAGQCGVCSVARGASANGTCMPLTGKPCNDWDICTLNDTCQAGVCKGSPHSPCLVDACYHPGGCDP